MTLRITIDANGDVIRTVEVHNVGHPKTLDTPEHDDLRRYNFSSDRTHGFVLHRRGLGATELARKVLQAITDKELGV
jgi:hypothetical protein